MAQGCMKSTKAQMARQASAIRSEMIAMRQSLAKFADGRTTGWRSLGRQLSHLQDLWGEYDDNYESFVRFAEEAEAFTEEQRQAMADAHQTFQSDLMILRDDVQLVLDAAGRRMRLKKTRETKTRRSSRWATGSRLPTTESMHR